MDGTMVVARWRHCALHLIQASLGAPEYTTQTASCLIGSAVFAQPSAEGPYTLEWAAPSPSKLPLHMCAFGPQSNTYSSLGPPNSASQTASLDRFGRYCTAHGIESLVVYKMGRPFPLKIALSLHGSLGAHEFITQTASRSVQPFLQG